VIGVEPRELAPGQPIDRLVPRTIEAALALARTSTRPSTPRLHGVDAAELQVKIRKASCFRPSAFGGADPALRLHRPEVTRSSRHRRRLDLDPDLRRRRGYARTRQAKETVGQRRIEADSIRDRCGPRWCPPGASSKRPGADHRLSGAGAAAEGALKRRARGGAGRPATTLDVLNSQQELLNARVNLITAQRDRVVASYAVVQATGQLSARALALRVQIYSAKQHFDQVKDLAAGARTPDGR
jgi:outer membrane protein